MTEPFSPPSNSKDDRIFVTGATGFIGANLVKLLLDQGYAVRLLVRPSAPRDNLPPPSPRVEIVEGDLLSPNLASQLQGCRYLFHVAAHYTLWQRDRNLLYQSNVLGTRTILAAAKTAGIERTVYTSSVAAIGVSGSDRPVDETHQSPPDKLVGHYKKSKYWAEREAIAASQSGQNVVIVNPSTPIGPRDIKPTPTGDIILRFLQRRMPAYVDTGLNLIHVEDVAWGHLRALERGVSGRRYILGHQNMSLKAMLGLLSEITGLPAPTRTVPLWLPLGVAWVEEMLLAKVGYKPTVPIDGVRMSAKPMYYDASRSIAELGLPQTPIDRALKEAVEWFRANGQ
jgi:dihydroflavonol-4-reductase